MQNQCLLIRHYFFGSLLLFIREECVVFHGLISDSLQVFFGFLLVLDILQELMKFLFYARLRKSKQTFWICSYCSLSVFRRTIASWVISGVAVLAPYVWLQTHDLFWALKELMSLLTAVFAPSTLLDCRIVGDQCVFAAFFSLLDNSFDHCLPNFKMFIRICCKVDMQGFFIPVPPCLIKQFLLEKLCSWSSWETSFRLGTCASYLYLAVGFSLKLLLCLSTWSNDLANKVHQGVIRRRNENFSMLLGWFVVVWGYVGWIHL